MTSNAGRKTLGTLILVAVLVGAIPILSQSLDGLNISVSSVENYTTTLPYNNNWSNNATLTNLTSSDGQLQINLSNNAMEGSYLSLDISEEETKETLNRLTYEAENIRESPDGQVRAINITVQSSEDDFSTIESETTYSLENGANEIYLDNFTEIYKDIRIKAEFYTALEDQTPYLNSLSLSGERYIEDHLGSDYLQRFVLLIVVAVLMIILVSWASGRV